MGEFVRLRFEGPVAEIQLARPEKRNALTQAMWAALAQHARTADAHGETKVIVLSGGESGAFAAGADMQEFEEIYATRARAEAASRQIAEALDCLAGCRKPVLAAIEGACVGGGVSLALTADLRIASATARFAVTPARLGLLYPPADTRRLVQCLGAPAAKDLLFTGRLVDAAEALQLGLINRLTGAGQARALAYSLASEIAAASQFSVRGAKRMIEAQAPEAELMELYLDAFGGKDFAEGYRAFLEKRPPRFV